MELNRRDFLKGALTTGALAVGGTALTACSSNDVGSNDTTNAASTGDSGYMTAELYSKEWEFEIAPDPINDDDISETIEADLIVVGAGTSGLVTARSAQESGLDVVVISASSKPISRGGSNNAIYSKAMEEKGLARQSAFNIEKEIAMQYNGVDQAKWYKYYHNSEEAMNWMIDSMEGAGFRTEIEGSSDMDEDSIFFSALAAHGWVNDENSTIGMTQPFVVSTLSEKIQNDNGRIFFNNVARQLVRDDNNTGRVSAVIAEQEDGSFVKYVGKKAIVLATGDFSSNRDMMTKYAPNAVDMVSQEIYDSEPDYDKEFAFGGLFPGDGQRMGLWIGAAWQKNIPCCPMTGYPTAGTVSNVYKNFWGLLINRNGERFMNEYTSGTPGGKAQSMQPGGESFGIWDTGYSNMPDWYLQNSSYGIDEPLTPDAIIASWQESVEAGLYVQADTVEELIDKLGLPKEATTETIEQYNRVCQAQNDTDFFKKSDYLFPIGTPPFYGHKSEGVPTFLTILGGLRTDSNMRVCDENDNPIEGLFNVGTMVGDFYSGLYTFQIEGVNYGACCLTFGYLTGKYIAETN